MNPIMARERYELTGMYLKRMIMKIIALLILSFVLNVTASALPLNVIFCENVRVKLQSTRITAPERAALLVLKAQLQCTYF